MNITSGKWATALITLSLSLSACSEKDSDKSGAEDQTSTSAETAAIDPRANLAAGLDNPGTAISNLALIQELPMPEGFYDASPLWKAKPPKTASEAGDSEAKEEPAPNPISYANTDLAFSGDRIVMGNFHGFNVFNRQEDGAIEHAVSVVCPGGQGDVSIRGDLVFYSVEQNRARLDCGTGGVEGKTSSERFLGIRIFDISDLQAPRQVAAVQTCRGSHTHTLVPDPSDDNIVYIYVQGSQNPRPGSELEGCSAGEPADNPDTALYSIDVIKVALDAPETAAVVNQPHIFADKETGAINGLWGGGKLEEGAQKTAVTNHCHDITVFPAHNLAAGACSGNGILLDISDPENPARISEISNPNMAYWHAAIFNNDATKVMFTDEWGGGVGAHCRPEDPQDWGGNVVADITDEGLVGRGLFKIPGVQSDTENCVAHNGSLIPVPGRDVMVQAWYSGGISVIDFTDSDNPFEIAYYDRGPISTEENYLGGYWAAYWHNGRIYATDIVRGLDIFKLEPSDYLSTGEIAAAESVTFLEANSQTQELFTW